MDSTTTNPTIAVFLATHNGKNWVLEQIKSILLQANVKICIFISDDQSTDGTIELIQTSFKNETRIKYIKPPSTGGSAARNFMHLVRETEFSEFQYCAFADQDDIWKPNKCIEAITTMRIENTCGYSCSTIAFHLGNDGQLLRQASVKRDVDYLFEGAGQGCTFVFEQRLASSFKDFLVTHQSICKDVHYHDWLLYAFARSFGYTWTIDPRPYVYYRQHQNNDTGSRHSARGIVLRLRKLANGWYFREILKITNIIATANPLDAKANELRSLLTNRAGFGKTFRIIKISLLHGRRRLIDRLITSIFLLSGNLPLK